MREDERHVKVPGFGRNINLPIRPEITWPDLTLPVCLSMKERTREEWAAWWAGSQKKSVREENKLNER